MALAYLLSPTFQIENTAGRPVTGGWLEVYVAGSRTKYYCASDWDGTLHPFKIPLDSLGANIVLASPANAYDVYVYNRFGSLIMSRYNVIPSTGEGGGGGGTTYTAGDGIDITDDNISVKYGKGGIKVNASNELEVNAGKGLEFEADGKLNVKVGDGLTYNSDNNAIEVNKDEINNYVDKSLFVLNTDAITDWIDITDEFVFLNGFRAYYQVDPTILQFKPMYSPSSNLLKFFGEMRINRTSAVTTNPNWTIMFKYVGNRFYTNKTALTLDNRPTLYPFAPIGNTLTAPVTNNAGGSQTGLAKIVWAGSYNSEYNEEGIGMQILFANNTVYGTILTNLIYKVTPIIY